MSQNHTYSNFKKRLVDILDAKGMPDVKVEQIRIWLSSDKKDLAKSFKEIADAGEKMQQDSGASLNGKYSADVLGFNTLMSIEDTRVEENSGVEFPGDCLEPYVGTALNFGDKDFLDNEVVLVEIGT